MSWKKWPYWLRGGTIGAGSATLFAMLFYSCTRGVIGTIGYGCVYFLVFELFPVTWFKNFLGSLWDAYFFSPVTSFGGSIVVWFFIGSLIGLVMVPLKQKGKGSNPCVRN